MVLTLRIATRTGQRFVICDDSLHEGENLLGDKGPVADAWEIRDDNTSMFYVPLPAESFHQADNWPQRPIPPHVEAFILRYPLAYWRGHPGQEHSST